MAELNAGPYEYGADPGDYTADAVIAWLKSEAPTSDQYDAVLRSEADGRARTSVLALAGSSTTPPAPSPSTTSNPDGEPTPGTTEPGAVPSEQPPADPDNPVKDGQPDGGETADAEPAENPELANIQSDRPLWYVETNGQPPEDKKDLYKVIQPAGSVV